MRNGIVATAAIGNAAGSRANSTASAADEREAQHPGCDRDRRVVAQRAHLVGVRDVHGEDQRGASSSAPSSSHARARSPRTTSAAAASAEQTISGTADPTCVSISALIVGVGRRAARQARAARSG